MVLAITAVDIRHEYFPYLTIRSMIMPIIIVVFIKLVFQTDSSRITIDYKCYYLYYSIYNQWYYIKILIFNFILFYSRATYPANRALLEKKYII